MSGETMMWIQFRKRDVGQNNSKFSAFAETFEHIHDIQRTNIQEK